MHFKKQEKSFFFVARSEDVAGKNASRAGKPVGKGSNESRNTSKRNEKISVSVLSHPRIGGKVDSKRFSVLFVPLNAHKRLGRGTPSDFLKTAPAFPSETRSQCSRTLN